MITKPFTDRSYSNAYTLVMIPRVTMVTENHVIVWVGAETRAAYTDCNVRILLRSLTDGVLGLGKSSQLLVLEALHKMSSHLVFIECQVSYVIPNSRVVCSSYCPQPTVVTAGLLLLHMCHRQKQSIVGDQWLVQLGNLQLNTRLKFASVAAVKKNDRSSDQCCWNPVLPLVVKENLNSCIKLKESIMYIP